MFGILPPDGGLGLPLFNAACNSFR